MIRLIFALLFLGGSTFVQAVPTDELLYKITEHVVKVNVALASGRTGSGSGVVIAKDRIVTNCHVVANAVGVSVTANGVSYTASAITPDWYHDICLVKVEGLNAPVATIGSSKSLQYEQPVFAIGYPNLSPTPTSTSGYVKGLFPMDDSVIIRASSTFRLGASGGGVFDSFGHLVGVITLKSPGRHAYYYNMPVEWVKALIDKPELAINAQTEPAFWAGSADQWPFFMRVVHPYLTKDWTSLLTVATDWIKKEPKNIEAWFYLAAAEYAIKDSQNAKLHLQKVMAMNPQHSQALYYLALIAEDNGRPVDVQMNIALLAKLDVDAAAKLQLEIDSKH